MGCPRGSGAEYVRASGRDEIMALAADGIKGPAVGDEGDPVSVPDEPVRLLSPAAAASRCFLRRTNSARRCFTSDEAIALCSCFSFFLRSSNFSSCSAIFCLSRSFCICCCCCNCACSSSCFCCAFCSSSNFCCASKNY